ncbi:single-stranded-DNA-specific exonuclease C-terminal domain-containing protein [Cohnella kolymensis]|uniref:single-stranded-DNA-specific exonuclease C-terminal domain-containing protein n=1 Tax=Cohnella kolymensis TaxID=1590652 RepID=UPI0013793171|nr:single-stranded-DNA-specific exonuclease C-terminal domain-containing protein [Cohnella kolymensis]
MFKLGHALLGRPVLEYADLAAIGTIADLMPLTGENRIIARAGLELMRRRPSPGIRALCKACGVEPEQLTSGRIGFGLAPRLNAGGRLEHADSAVKLLSADNEQEAELLAIELDRLNGERQRLVEQTLIEADDKWQSSCASEGMRNVIVIAEEGWNAGIAGLVASKLVERYYRPAVILACDPATGLCKGSARSIDGFDLYEALTEYAGLMEHYGGHQAAAGLTIARDRVDQLREGLHKLAGERLSPEQWQPKKRADLSCSLEDLTIAAHEELARLEPFGQGNPTPRFVLSGVRISETRTLGKENKHLRLTVEQNGRKIEALGFGMGEHRQRLTPGLSIDLLGELGVNEWNGTRRAQLVFQDWKTDQLLIHDRRSEKAVWPALEKLLLNRTEGCIIGCASQELYQEALSRLSHTGIPIYPLAPGGANAATVSETASAQQRTRPLSGWRELFLIGLPDNEQNVLILKHWLHPEYGGETVHIYSEHGSPQAEEPYTAFPERSHFAEVYARFRDQGTWLDSPNGFLQATASAAGWPLAVVRMMEEVFIELGFITVQGVTRKVEAKPARKELDESARYRRSRTQFEASALAKMSSRELHNWLTACHTVNTGSIR